MADDKYKLACIEYVAAQRALKDITTAIGQHIDNCRNQAIRDWLAENPGRQEWEAPAGQWEKSPHLRDAYACEYDDDGQAYFAHHNGDAGAYLAEVCNHCSQAHFAIQARKEAKKRFGLAKRRISVMGAAAK